MDIVPTPGNNIWEQITDIADFIEEPLSLNELFDAELTTGNPIHTGQMTNAAFNLYGETRHSESVNHLNASTMLPKTQVPTTPRGNHTSRVPLTSTVSPASTTSLTVTTGVTQSPRLIQSSSSPTLTTKTAESSGKSSQHTNKPIHPMTGGFMLKADNASLFFDINSTMVAPLENNLRNNSSLKLNKYPKSNESTDARNPITFSAINPPYTETTSRVNKTVLQTTTRASTTAFWSKVNYITKTKPKTNSIESTRRKTQKPVWTSKSSVFVTKTFRPSVTATNIGTRTNASFRTPSTNSSIIGIPVQTMSPRTTTSDDGTHSSNSIILYTVPPVCALMLIILIVSLIVIFCRRRWTRRARYPEKNCYTATYVMVNKPIHNYTARATRPRRSLRRQEKTTPRVLCWLDQAIEQKSSLWLKSRGDMSSVTNSAMVAEISENGDITPKPPSVLHENMMCEVIRAFEPRTDQHLELRVHDTVMLLECGDDGWVRGQTDAGSGWFPDVCVRPLISEVTVSSMSDDVFINSSSKPSLPHESRVSTFKLRQKSQFPRLQFTDISLDDSQRPNGHSVVPTRGDESSANIMEISEKRPILYDLSDKTQESHAGDISTFSNETSVDDNSECRAVEHDEVKGQQSPNFPGPLDKYITLENLANIVADKNVDLFALSRQMDQLPGSGPGSVEKSDSQKSSLLGASAIGNDDAVEQMNELPRAEPACDDDDHDDDDDDDDDIGGGVEASQVEDRTKKNSHDETTAGDDTSLERSLSQNTNDSGVQGMNDSNEGENIVPIKVRALYPYTACTENEISLAEGDELTLCDAVGDELWLKGCCQATGYTGWFPKNYVQEITPLSDPSSPATPNCVDATPGTPTSSFIPHRVLYSYIGQYPEDLSFITDDVILVTQQLDNGWWHGTKGENSGWFPGSYVTPLKPDDSQTSHVISPVSSGESGVELRMQKTDIPDTTRQTPRATKRLSKSRRPPEPAPSPPSHRNSAASSEDLDASREKESPGDNSLVNGPDAPQHPSVTKPDGTQPAAPKRFSKPKFSFNKQRIKATGDKKASLPTSRPPPPKPPHKNADKTKRVIQKPSFNKLSKSDISGPITLDHSTYNRIHLDRLSSSPPDQIRTLRNDFDQTTTASTSPSDASLAYSGSFHSTNPTVPMLPANTSVNQSHSFHAADLKHPMYFTQRSRSPASSSSGTPSTPTCASPFSPLANVNNNSDAKGGASSEIPTVHSRQTPSHSRTPYLTTPRIYSRALDTPPKMSPKPSLLKPPVPHITRPSELSQTAADPVDLPIVVANGKHGQSIAASGAAKQYQAPGISQRPTMPPPRPPRTLQFVPSSTENQERSGQAQGQAAASSHMVSDYNQDATSLHIYENDGSTMDYSLV